jgi:hypothetical protein
MLNVVKMEAEGVLLDGVEESTVDAVPQRNIRVDRSCAELLQSTHAGHGFGVFKPEQQMLSRVGLDLLQVLNLVLVDENPDDSEVKVQVAHHLSP